MPWVPIHDHPSDRNLRRYIWQGDGLPDNHNADVLITFDMVTGLRWWRCNHCAVEELWNTDTSADRVITHAHRHTGPWWRRALARLRA